MIFRSSGKIRKRKPQNNIFFGTALRRWGKMKSPSAWAAPRLENIDLSKFFKTFFEISFIIHIEIKPGLVYTKRKNPCIVRDGLSFEPTLFIREFLSFRSLQASIYRGSGNRKGKYPPVQDRYKTRLNGKGGDLFYA